MGRRRTGTLEWVPATSAKPAHWKARIRLNDGSRPWHHFDPSVTEEKARAHAQKLTSEAKRKNIRRAPAPSLGSPETCTKWWGRYFEWREARGQSSVKDAKSRVAKWIAPSIGSKVMADVTREDLERIVHKLDDAVTAEEISWKTAGNIWGEVTSAFGQACTSKDATLRVRDDNPSANVQGPDGGVTRAKPILYPDEVTKLLGCKLVPLERRRVYAVAVYTAARSNELAALTAADVDMDHARISIAKQVDRETGDDKKTKTRRVRSFEAEAELLPLLRVLTHERPTGRLLRLPVDEERAKLLRADLMTAGVKRAELHTSDTSRAWIVFHNLRDTALTWMAVRGDDPVKIQWRAGHTDFKMTQAYISAGRNVGALFGAPFPELPARLFDGDAAAQAGEWSAIQSDDPPTVTDRHVFPNRKQRPQRDSNPR